MDRVDCVVVGAGVVGLAIGRALALAGRGVLVLESERHFGTGTEWTVDALLEGEHRERYV